MENHRLGPTRYHDNGISFDGGGKRTFSYQREALDWIDGQCERDSCSNEKGLHTA